MVSSLRKPQKKNRNHKETVNNLINRSCLVVNQMFVNWKSFVGCLVAIIVMKKRNVCASNLSIDLCQQPIVGGCTLCRKATKMAGTS